MKIDTDNNLIIPGSLEISDLKAIKVVGELNKVEDFLQGQLTSDISLLNNGASQLSCICDHKGQVMADFIVLKQDNEFFIIIQKDFISIFTGELEIFAKFGSVSFDVCDHKIIGEICNKGDSDNFYYSNDEFELNLHLKKSNYKNKNSINLDMWNAANKILGILHLDKSDSGKFRPLEINFDKQRVSFEKGCFRGQEIVARMKYLGIDRRKFCTFIVNNDFVENNLIKSIGKIINLDDKKIFNGIVKKDDIEEVKKISGIISIL